MRILESISWATIETALRARPQGVPLALPRGASIDTRTLEKGDVFFALKGENADGHDHLESAFAQGAACAVIKDASRAPAGTFNLVVDEPERALFELARLIRSRSRATFVAITGSAGKTTAKDFTASLLEGRGPVLSTRGNLNNHLGVPLTLARLEVEDWAAVIECGMSRAGELKHLVRLIQPRIAAITNVAAAHLEFFASIDEIAEAKSEIFETLGPGDVAIAPSDDRRLVQRATQSGGSARLFGAGPASSTRAENISMTLEGSQFDLHHDRKEVAVCLQAPGPHAISNFLLAATVALALGIPTEDLVGRARGLALGGNRGAVKRLPDDIVLIDDTYNSNPKALLSAIDTLALARDRRRVACLGDMLELGPTGEELHRAAGVAIGSRVDLLLGVGPLARRMVEASPLHGDAKKHYANSTELAAEIPALLRIRDAVLVKGSRGVRMERVVDAVLTAHPGVPA